MFVTANTDERDFRLPRDVVPTRYELTIAPDLDAASFVGQERIELEVVAPTSSIVCNAAELEVTKATLSWPGGSPQAVDLTISLDEQLERVTFTPPRQVLTGPCVLECEFSGVLNDKLRGFYRSTFKDESGQRARAGGDPVRVDRCEEGLSLLGRAGPQSRLLGHPRS